MLKFTGKTFLTTSNKKYYSYVNHKVLFQCHENHLTMKNIVSPSFLFFFNQNTYQAIEHSRIITTGGHYIYASDDFLCKAFSTTVGFWSCSGLVSMGRICLGYTGDCYVRYTCVCNSYNEISSITAQWGFDHNGVNILPVGWDHHGGRFYYIL
jgi:hypothetical protein